MGHETEFKSDPFGLRVLVQSYLVLFMNLFHVHLVQDVFLIFLFVLFLPFSKELFPRCQSMTLVDNRHDITRRKLTFNTSFERDRMCRPACPDPQNWIYSSRQGNAMHIAMAWSLLFQTLNSVQMKVT